LDGFSGGASQKVTAATFWLLFVVYRCISVIIVDPGFQKMDNRPLILTATVIGILLIGLMVYVTLVRAEFPLTLMILTLIVSVVFLYLLRDVLLRPQDGGESPLLRSAGGIVLGSVMFLVGAFVYDYIFRQEMRWEFYTGMGLPSLVIGVWWFFSKRRNKSSGLDGP
jgi:hypothetical protein